MTLATIRIIPQELEIEVDYNATYLTGYFARKALIGAQIAVMRQSHIDELVAKADQGVKRLFNQNRGWNYAEDPVVAGTRNTLSLMRADKVRYEWSEERQSVITHISSEQDFSASVPFVRLDKFMLVKPEAKIPTAKEIARWKAAYE